MDLSAAEVREALAACRIHKPEQHPWSSTLSDAYDRPRAVAHRPDLIVVHIPTLPQLLAATLPALIEGAEVHGPPYLSHARQASRDLTARSAIPDVRVPSIGPENEAVAFAMAWMDIPRLFAACYLDGLRLRLGQEKTAPQGPPCSAWRFTDVPSSVCRVRMDIYCYGYESATGAREETAIQQQARSYAFRPGPTDLSGIKFVIESKSPTVFDRHESDIYQLADGTPISMQQSETGARAILHKLFYFMLEAEVEWGLLDCGIRTILVYLGHHNGVPYLAISNALDVDRTDPNVFEITTAALLQPHGAVLPGLQQALKGAVPNLPPWTPAEVQHSSKSASDLQHSSKSASDRPRTRSQIAGENLAPLQRSFVLVAADGSRSTFTTVPVLTDHSRSSHSSETSDGSLSSPSDSRLFDTSPSRADRYRAFSADTTPEVAHQAAFKPHVSEDDVSSTAHAPETPVKTSDPPAIQITRPMGTGSSAEVLLAVTEDLASYLVQVSTLGSDEMELTVLPRIKIADRDPESEEALNRDAAIRSRLPCDVPTAQFIGLFANDGEHPHLSMLTSYDGVPLTTYDDITTQQRQALLDSVIVLHAHGVEHADLKPSNLTLRDDGSIGIQDFGVSIDDHDCPGDSCFELRRLKEDLFGLPPQ